VFGSDGRDHVVYEVQAINISGLPWNIRSLRDEGTNGRVYGRWSDKRVRTVLVAMGSGKPIARLDPGQGGVFHLTFCRARSSTGYSSAPHLHRHAEATGEPARMGPVVVGPRTNALPLGQVVVTWG
jgi:hypothetical protein